MTSNASTRRCLALATALAGALLLAGSGTAAAAHINVVVIDGSINPASSEYIQTAIAKSEEDGAEALLIEIDTPGGRRILN